MATDITDIVPSLKDIFIFKLGYKVIVFMLYFLLHFFFLVIQQIVTISI